MDAQGTEIIMPEAFVRTIKRDYVRVSPIPDARTVLESLALVVGAL
jgi:hypothetical protein